MWLLFNQNILVTDIPRCESTPGPFALRQCARGVTSPTPKFGLTPLIWCKISSANGMSYYLLGNSVTLGTCPFSFSVNKVTAGSCRLNGNSLFTCMRRMLSACRQFFLTDPKLQERAAFVIEHVMKLGSDRLRSPIDDLNFFAFHRVYRLYLDFCVYDLKMCTGILFRLMVGDKRKRVIWRVWKI